MRGNSFVLVGLPSFRTKVDSMSQTFSEYEWAFRVRCARCEHPHPDFVGPEIPHKVGVATPNAFDRLICPVCGGTRWHHPMTGRRIKFNLFNPLTWIMWLCTDWEWRPDTVTMLPSAPDKTSDADENLATEVLPEE
jgi:hypothetical protein